MDINLDLKKRDNKKRILMLIASLSIIGLFGLLSFSFINAQGQVNSNYDFDELNNEYSQVLVSGNNYSLNQEQEDLALSFTEEVIPPSERPEITPPENEESIVENIAEETGPEIEPTETSHDETNNNIEAETETVEIVDNTVNQNDSNPETDAPVVPSPNSGSEDTLAETDITDHSSGGGEEEGLGDEGDNTQEEEENQISKNPLIQCTIEEGELVQGKSYAFQVRCTDYHGTLIDPFYYQVKINDEITYSTGTDAEGFVTYRAMDSLLMGENRITIYVEDSEGNTGQVTYSISVESEEEVLLDEYVSLRIDARILGLGTLLSVDERIYKEESAAHFVDRVLNEYGFNPISSNNLYGYYLARISKPGMLSSIDIIQIPEEISSVISDVDYELWQPDSLGERDFNGYSGWVYLYNGAYMGVGLSNITLYDGDEIIICFTLSNGGEYDGTLLYYGDW